MINLTPQPNEEKNWNKEFDKLFWLHRVPKYTKQAHDLKEFIAIIEAETERRTEERIAKFAAELAVHSDDCMNIRVVPLNIFLARI